MCPYLNMVKDFGKAVAAFDVMPETRPIAQPKELTVYTRLIAAPADKLEQTF